MPILVRFNPVRARINHTADLTISSNKHPHRAREKEHNEYKCYSREPTTFETHAKYQIRHFDVMMLVNFIGSSGQYKGHTNSNHLWAEIVLI